MISLLVGDTSPDPGKVSSRPCHAARYTFLVIEIQDIHSVCAGDFSQLSIFSVGMLAEPMRLQQSRNWNIRKMCKILIGT